MKPLFSSQYRCKKVVLQVFLTTFFSTGSKLMMLLMRSHEPKAAGRTEAIDST